jgi:tetratricopeptide (TPR) repeat protein
MKIKISLIAFIIASFVFQAYSDDQESIIKQLIQEGVALHDHGEYEKAIEKYREALKLNPSTVQATYEMSLTYLAMKDFENASTYSSIVISTQDDKLSPGAYAVKSEALVEMGYPEEAIALLQEGLEKLGDEYILHFNMALNYYKIDNIDKTVEHIKKAIDLDKSHSGAFLLNAYALKDKGLWVQSILSMQMFLLLEPDSKRSKNAFEELLQTMRIIKTDKPVVRSFNHPLSEEEITHNQEPIPPLTEEEGLNRNLVYQAIISTLDSLQTTSAAEDEYAQFCAVNRSIIQVLQDESYNGNKLGIFWTFYIPFFSYIEHSNYYDTFCRYISVSYFPESMEWWKQNPETAENFVNWFEKGDNI